MKPPFKVAFHGSIGAPRLLLESTGVNLEHARDLARMAARNLGPAHTDCYIFDGETDVLTEHHKIGHVPFFEPRAVK